MNRFAKKTIGFTLIEIMIVIGIFGLILTAVMMLFLQGTRTYRQSVTMAQMRFRTQKAVDDMKSELVDALLLSGANRLDRISFQRPTPIEDSVGADPRYVDTSSLMPYFGNGRLQRAGMGDDNIDFNRNGFPNVTFEFMSDSIINESAIGFDLNNDNDMADVFERGRIVRTVRNSAGVIVQQRNLTDGWVFKPQTPGGFTLNPNMTDLAPFDMDNLDGLRDDPDPIFLIVNDAGQPDPAGQRLQIKVFSMEFINRRPRLVSCETTVTSINK